MAEPLLSTDELTVLGGPAEISVDVDFGPSGERGSLTFVGNGKPETSLELPAGIDSVNVFDTYVNASPSDDEYQFLYQYLPSEGGSANWTKIIKLASSSYSYNQTETFVSGSTDSPIVINLASFLPVDLFAIYSESDFNIQANILGSNPISFGLSIGELSNLTLPITINGLEYIDGAWQPLSGPKTVHLLITIKNNIS